MYYSLVANESSVKSENTDAVLVPGVGRTTSNDTKGMNGKHFKR